MSQKSPSSKLLKYRFDLSCEGKDGLENVSFEEIAQYLKSPEYIGKELVIWVRRCECDSFLGGYVFSKQDEMTLCAVTTPHVSKDRGFSGNAAPTGVR